MKKYQQGDVVYIDFGKSDNNEINGIRPAVIVSADDYNFNTDYLVVLPITNHGTYFNSYYTLNGYENIRGRVNVSQVHAFSKSRVMSLVVDHLRRADFKVIMGKLAGVFLEYAI